MPVLRRVSLREDLLRPAVHYGGCQPFNSEENDSFEIGFKADLLDGRMRLNMAYFDVTYDSLQRDAVLVVKDASGNDFQETVAVNEGESSNSGVEIELIYLPTDNLRIDANLWHYGSQIRYLCAFPGYGDVRSFRSRAAGRFKVSRCSFFARTDDGSRGDL